MGTIQSVFCTAGVLWLDFGFSFLKKLNMNFEYFAMKAVQQYNQRSAVSAKIINPWLRNVSGVNWHFFVLHDLILREQWAVVSPLLTLTFSLSLFSAHYFSPTSGTPRPMSIQTSSYSATPVNDNQSETVDGWEGSWYSDNVSRRMEEGCGRRLILHFGPGSLCAPPVVVVASIAGRY